MPIHRFSQSLRYLGLALTLLGACSNPDTDDITREVKRGDAGKDAADEAPVDAAEELDASDDVPDASDALDADEVDAGEALDATIADATSDVTSDSVVENDAAPDAPAVTDAASDAAAPRGLYVQPTTGLDSNDGMQATPYKTIAYAASQAAAGDTIWLLPGTYDGSTEPRFMSTSSAPCGAAAGIVIPTGVTVRAVVPGQAILRIQAAHGFCMTGGAVIDLDMGFVVSGGVIVRVTSGDVLLEGTSISRAGTGGSGNLFAIQAGGTSHVTIRPGRLANLIAPPSYKYANAEGTATLEVIGATITGSVTDNGSGNSVFLSRENGHVILDAVTVRNFTNANAIWMQGASKVTLRNGTLLEGTEATQDGVLVMGSGTLTLQNATLRQFESAIGSSTNNTVNNPTIVATDAVLELNEQGMTLSGANSALTANVSFTRGAIRDNTSNGVFSTLPGSYTFDGTRIANNGFMGVNMSNTSKEYHLKLRRSEVSGNYRSGIWLQGASGSTLDLGSLSDPGENVLRGNDTGTTNGDANLRLNTAGILASALGNTWNVVATATPTQLATDAEGHYGVVGAGALLEVTTGLGINYSLSAGTLRLAQNP